MKTETIPELYVSRYGEPDFRNPIIRLRVTGSGPDGSSRHFGKLGSLVFSRVAGQFTHRSMMGFHQSSNELVTRLVRSLKLSDQDTQLLAKRIRDRVGEEQRKLREKLCHLDPRPDVVDMAV